jgi:hypothetical protein
MLRLTIWSLAALEPRAPQPRVRHKDVGGRRDGRPLRVNLHEWGLFNSNVLPRIEIKMPDRAFPRPWSSEEHSGHFVVRDRKGQALAHVYFENERGRRSAAKTKLVTKDEARRIAANIATMPQLLQGTRSWSLKLHSITRQDDVLQDGVNLVFPALSREHPVMADAGLHVVTP